MILLDGYNRKGEKEYFVVENINGVNERKKLRTLKSLKSTKAFKNKNNRIHYVYTSEHKNEHRQETSGDLTNKLTEMGLMNDTTQIDLFAHSYGGRRSFQFAMDYPDSVRSITTIGTPYDINLLGSGANWVDENLVGIPIISPDEYSGYQDFNKENQRTDNGIIHSNVYTDMKSEAMIEDIDHLKAANPKVYQQIQEMEITAAAGRYEPEMCQDRVVSVKSQHGEKLEDLIDNRPDYEVQGLVGHLDEVSNEEFIDLISEVNRAQKE